MHTDHPITDYSAIVGTNTHLLDVREPDEVAAGTLADSINIPVGELPDRLDELDSSRRVLVFCRSGGRSTAAAKLLTEAGFVDVVNLSGGMLALE